MDIFLLLCCCLPQPALAQQYQRIDIPSSPNPVGSGARALGMGGAFIAVADDATAASWNPGGLIQLKRGSEMSVVGSIFHRVEKNESEKNHEASGWQSVSEKNINYLSFAYPFNLLNRNMIMSLNYQHLFDFTREWDFLIMERSNPVHSDRNVHYKQEGSLSAIGIACCIQITPKFSFGLTLNIWDDRLSKNNWKQTRYEKETGIYLPDDISFTDEYFTSDQYSLKGFNLNMGFLWNINDKLTVGTVFKTPFTADITHELTYRSSHSPHTQSFTEDETLNMPMSYGIGVSYRFSDQFTVSGDIYRTEWQNFVLTDSQGHDISLVTGMSAEQSDIDPAHQLRFGAEYLFIKEKYIIPLRCGFFYDPAPAQARPDDFFGMCFGSGISIGSYVFDFACQYRFGKDVGKSALQHMDFSQDIEEYTFYASVIYHF